MKASEHPDYVTEADYLKAVRAAAGSSITDIDSRHWGPSGAEIADKEAEEILRSWAEYRKVTLRASLDRPYFGRVDLDAATYYVGQTGVKQPETRERLVVDWRAQVATAFYRPGPEVRLKRRFDIDAGELVEIFDDLIEPGAGREADPALIQILAGSRGQELRPIVATIQAEQDELIRAVDSFLHIQGGAGTGKTVVALHRLAYLLYTYRVETRRQKELRVAVFGPNSLFLGYVASVLPSLGESNVFHTTFEDWFTRWCGRDAVKLPAWDDALDRLISQPPSVDGSTEVAARARLKGSLRMGKLLERLVAERQAQVLANLQGRPISFEVSERFGVTLRLGVGPADRERITREAETQPLNRGREWARQWLWPRLRAQLDRRYGQAVGEGGKAPQALANAARQALETALEDLWPVVQFKQTYQKLISDKDRLAELASGLFEATEVGLLRTSKLGVDDLGPLSYTRLLVDGPARVRDTRGQETEVIQKFDHLVVDEAQDLAPLQLAVLRAHADGATVLGDVSQGVNPFRGIREWREIDGVLNSASAVARQVNLYQSYRSTRPIIEFANQILASVGVADASRLQPFPRDGEPPQLIHAHTEAAMMDEIATILDEVAGAEFQSAAVICKTAAHARRIASALETRLRATFALIARASDSRTADIVVVPGYLAKGMDFDVVVVAGVDVGTYGTSQLDAKLLYVAVTRALHRLYVLWTGERSPLLVS